MTTRREQRIALPSPAPGTERYLSVLHYGKRESRPHAYLQAGLHADELPGMLVLHHLRDLLDSADARGAIRGRATLVPAANPLGLSQSVQGQMVGRLDLDAGRNFNRHFPDLREAVIDRVRDRLDDDAHANVERVRAAMVESVAALHSHNDAERLRHVLLALAADADICLDLHCDSEALLHVFTGTPLWPRASGLAARLGAHGVFLATVSGGEPFDEAIGGPWWAVAERFPQFPLPPACLCSTVELRGMHDVDDALARSDAGNLYGFLVDEGVVDDTPTPAPDLACEAVPLESVEYVRADTAGLLLYHAAPGERVKAGQRVASILDPMHHGKQARTPLTCSVDGFVFARSAQRFARPGAVVMSIAGHETVARPSGVGLLTD